jgi:serine/threonine protein kinase/formylglycine-generating enzyme required for sulfatase activity
MGATAAVHPADPILQAYGLGKLDDVSSASVSQHLERCDTCQQRVAALSSDEFLGRLQQAKVMSDRAASGWSPSAGSSTEGISGPIVPPPPADTLPPELVDHPDWEIVRELGRGGMGVVYLANNRLMGRPEVLKVVGRHLIERPGVADRFLREIRSAGRLQHPNIVTAYSARQLGQSLVFAMEYVKGYDLAKLVKSSGPLPIAHSCHFIHQAALGLQHALENEMVHRDIKPANLIVKEGKKGILKVLDFGLAKVTSEGQSDGSLTREGQMIGTPDFIAPEQIRDAKSADIRADIYSLGCTLYYLLSGGPPFQGDHLWDIYQAHFSMEAGPLNLVRPEVPVELAAVVAKMMAKEPGRRFQTPGEVARALTPFFKPAAKQPTNAGTEVSQLAPPVTGIPTTRVAVPPTEIPTSLAQVPAPPATKPTPQFERESLVAIKETEPLREPASAVKKPVIHKPRWLWPAAIAGAVVLSLVALFVVWRADTVKIKTSEGFIVLEDLPHDATVLVDDKKATFNWPGGGGPAEIAVAPGDHKVAVKKDGVKTYGEKVTVEARGKKILTVRFEPLKRTPLTEGAAEDGTARSPVRKNETEAATVRLGQSDAVERNESKARPAPKSVLDSQNDSAPKELGSSFTGMKMLLIDAGSFEMGSNEGDPNEKPPHLVHILRPFYLGEYEVQQEEYEKVIGVNPSKYMHTQNPVESLLWHDAVLFCNALSEKEKIKPFYEIQAKQVNVSDWNGPGYRLPTEAEWEYACRSGGLTQYAFGDDVSQLSSYAWYNVNSGRPTRPHPVGEKKPNGWGLYDMHGNVWEYCWDTLGFYEALPSSNPIGSVAGRGHVLRGGSCSTDASSLRSSRRMWSNRPSIASFGFRVARNVR